MRTRISYEALVLEFITMGQDAVIARLEAQGKSTRKVHLQMVERLKASGFTAIEKYERWISVKFNTTLEKRGRGRPKPEMGFKKMVKVVRGRTNRIVINVDPLLEHFGIEGDAIDDVMFAVLYREEGFVCKPILPKSEEEKKSLAEDDSEEDDGDDSEEGDSEDSEEADDA